ncbi:hypothetical protein ACXNAU_004003 [Escherichia coli]
MKKTLIALAVAASAAVSGSAMAWTQGGVNGGVDIGGSLTPEIKVIPWEAQIGTAVNDLAGVIKQGSTIADVQVNTTIPVLGIRTISKLGFVGREGVNPQIDYGDAVDFAKSVKGVAPVTLKMKNADDQSEIGILQAKMTVSARMARDMSNAYGSKETFNPYASQAGTVFFGGVGQTEGGIAVGDEEKNNAEILFPGVTGNFISLSGYGDLGSWGNSTVSGTSALYNGYYASGIKAGSVINLTLNSPADVDAINWTAQLPVTVSYQ